MEMEGTKRKINKTQERQAMHNEIAHGLLRSAQSMREQ